MAKHEPEIEILGPEDEKRQARIRAKFWPTVKKALRTIPFMNEVVAAYFAMLDSQTPMQARLTLIGALAYFVLPFDLVPDIILGVGFLDDASILAAAIASVRSSITDDHREAARQALADGPDDAKSKGETASA
ncbi:MAG TPA: YkvA family protein [Afifellaceae bacterium]|nr:YkvA family protein [Afifellaceae bacterium]